MREKKEEKQAEPLPVYESHPPGWLPKLHASADVGYPGFHPPRPRQDEDVLTTATIKDGLPYKLPVSVEYFSYNKMINEKFQNAPDTMGLLEGIMNEIFVRRADRIPPIPASTFKIPTRVTLNDAKRQAWFADLANPDVPLHKLGKSVPHGAKGHDLLDLLHSNNVAIPRAVWFLRVFGANETAGLRNKPNYVPTQYSIDMAILVTTYLRKQISEITLPSAPRPGLNIKQTFKGVLAEADSREKWISRFSYCLQLLRTFYAEDLVDHRTFLIWLVHQMVTCNLAQAGFIIRLVDEYLDDILASRALTRPLSEAFLMKLSEIRSSCATDILKDTDYLLKTNLQRVCLALPDSLVSPKLWNTYSPLLESVILENTIKPAADRHIQKNIRDLRYIISERFLDIKTRNEAMLFKGQIAEGSARLGNAVSCVKLLNSISSDTIMSSVVYFDQDTSAQTDFKDKLDLLLTWSVTPLQYGDHRPLAAVTLIKIWRDRACDRASRRDVATPSEFLQDQLFDWLDSSEVSEEKSNVRSIAVLFGKLVKYEIFSYSSYIQRLIARAETGLSSAEEPCSRHRSFLCWIPLYKADASLVNQRKVTLYGVRARRTPEEKTEREIRKEIRGVLPSLFEGTPDPIWTSASAVLEHCPILFSANRFEQVRTFRQWLIPHFQNCLRVKMEHAILFKAYLVTIELLAATKCFHSLLDLTIAMLEHTRGADSMNGLIGTFHRYATIWNCMDVMPIIVNALDSAHRNWKARGVPSHPLLTLLVKFDNRRYLSEEARKHLVADLEAFTLALQPRVQNPEPVPAVLPQILLLAGDPNPNAPSILANGLWMKYRASTDWGWKVWDNTVASLRQVPTMTLEAEARSACALRYGSFLWKVDQHLPNGLDGDILAWFTGPGRAELAGLSVEVWDVLKTVLLYLAVHGGVKTTTVLTGVVYPAWQMGGSGNVPEQQLAAANSLCCDMLLNEEGRVGDMPPTNLFEVQYIQTNRQSVFCEPNFSALVASIPALISLENNKDIPDQLRSDSTSLRGKLCHDPGFRQGAYRDLDIIRHAFENSPYLADQSADLCKREIAGLKVILHDANDETNIYDWPEVTSLLSPWKIAATTIQMQLQVKQLGRALSQESTVDIASANLNRLTTILFQHTKTAEEAYYVAEMARGADVFVAAKFINSGLQCMNDILTQHNSDAVNVDYLLRVGELLRILVHVSLPFRDTPAVTPAIEPPVQEAFVKTIHSHFKALSGQQTNVEESSHWMTSLTVLSRLLQFILSFKCGWTPKSKDTAHDITKLIFDLMLRCACEDYLDLCLYPILLDTLLVVLDEIPNEMKANYDPYHYYPNTTLEELSPDIPPEYRKQIAALLVDLPSRTVVTDLVNSYRDTDGKMVYGSPVINKPWEWIENLGEPPSSDPKDEEREVVKNSGSISLDHFGTRHTGESIKHTGAEGYWKTEGMVRGFEDGLTESVFIRDWRETRMNHETDLSPEILARLKPGLDAEALAAAEKSGATAKNSPSSSIVSRSSTSQYQHSPALSRQSSSTIEIIDVDNMPTNASTTKPIRDTGKRKASLASLSDDEIEIIEGPVVPRAGTSSKKQKSNKAPHIASKTKSKKR
ncbi:hypothetical protein CPB83DRAFT_314750 [Crepidotus variabilis]|uniref:Mediator of RNA polymerase II transcription subunit 12 n=1 Tax=Crepidotus variabilis TaxID=179855 RepID=A0A9P6EGA7_9AGAR|nr:hypothetical protein CPB83DRAFT_314750 [Crepidotus variabilis]